MAGLILVAIPWPWVDVSQVLSSHQGGSARPGSAASPAGVLGAGGGHIGGHARGNGAAMGQRYAGFTRGTRGLKGNAGSSGHHGGHLRRRDGARAPGWPGGVIEVVLLSRHFPRSPGSKGSRMVDEHKVSCAPGLQCAPRTWPHKVTRSSNVQLGKILSHICIASILQRIATH